MSPVVVTDSSSQLPAVLAARYGIRVVPLTVRIGGEEFLEGVDLDADEFWARFDGATAPAVSTSQPSPGHFAEVYAAAAEAGAESILSVHLTEALSGTLNSARLAARAAPVPVRVLDSGTSSFGIACCAWEAAEALLGGAGIDEAAEIAQRVGASLVNAFVVGGLALARAGGRMVIDPDSSGAPVLSMVGGDLQVIGRSDDLEEAVAMMVHQCTRAEVGGRLRVGVGVADAAAGPVADALDEAFRSVDSVVETVRYRVGPSVGVHTGPGTAGAFAYPVRAS